MPVYHSCSCYVHGSCQKDLVKQGSFILPCCHLFKYFLVIGSLDFSKFWHGAQNPYEVVPDSPVLWKNFCLKNLGNGPKIWLFEFKEKFGH